VTLLSTSPSISKKELEDYFDINLSKVEMREIRRNPFLLRKVAGNADVFIPLSNFRRIKAGPKVYVQALQVPYGRINSRTILRKIIVGNSKDALKDMMRLQLLQGTKSHSRLTLTNSQFVHDTLLKNFGLESEVLYPPVNDFLAAGIRKRKIILSVGRFFRGFYNDKRYDVLTEAFRELSSLLPEWEYHIVGSMSPDRKSQAYLNELTELNRGYPVFLHANAPHDSVKVLYNEAMVFWHGAGFRVDEKTHPEATEHFGMSVAEAMTAGCIPVAVNKGGLKEIVQQGKNGFLWETTDELIHYTTLVANLSSDELGTLQNNAIETYRRFGPTNFNERVMELFTPLLADQS
jgi:glycosyltransferase involved in cell wall biosynthesis